MAGGWEKKNYTCLFNEQWAMTGLREIKQFFGLLRHKCPRCQTKMSYYVILCQARDANGNPVGEQQNFPPRDYRYQLDLNFSLSRYSSNAPLQFGICSTGHKTAIIHLMGDYSSGYHVFYLDNQSKNDIVEKQIA